LNTQTTNIQALQSQVTNVTQEKQKLQGELNTKTTSIQALETQVSNVTQEKQKLQEEMNKEKRTIITLISAGTEYNERIQEAENLQFKIGYILAIIAIAMLIIATLMTLSILTGGLAGALSLGTASIATGMSAYCLFKAKSENKLSHEPFTIAN
jgi:hypothetical protein